jgi:hypothetical protein
MHPVDIHLKEDKELGNEEGKALGSGYFYGKRKEVEQSLLQYIIGDLILTWGGLHLSEVSMFPLGELHVEQAVKCGIWVQIQNLL